MPLQFHITDTELIKMAVAILCGGILGIERQYKNKIAGFRTIILITLGSAIFTMIAQQANLGVNINVITGIGFIGAGVIFKDNIAVSGLTTASVIWISAAIGMAAGAGDYLLAILSSVITIVVLSVFHILENYLDKLHHDKLYSIVFTTADHDNLARVEQLMKAHKLKSFRKKISKYNGCLEAAIIVTGHRKHISQLDKELLQMENVKSF